MDIRITHVLELSPTLLALVAASVGATATSPDRRAPSPEAASRLPAVPTDAAPTAAVEQSADTAEASPAADSNELDTAGWPWSADLHASTKGKTKEGLWRMKVGVSRPDPKPGFPVETAAAIGATGTTANTEASPAVDSAPASAAGSDDEDEFAAFRAAAAASDKTDAEAKASVPARKFSDADLGAVCNQAAVKLGDPAPIKAVIAEFVPAGEIAHSRNVPDDKRAEFVAALEAKAGIEFAG